MDNTIEIPTEYTTRKDFQRMSNHTSTFEGEIDLILAQSIYSASVQETTKLPSFTLVADLFNKGKLNNEAALDIVIWSWQAMPSKHTPLPPEAWKTLFESTWWGSRKQLGTVEHDRSPRNGKLPQRLYRGGNLLKPSWTVDLAVAEHFAKKHKVRMVHSIDPRIIQCRSFIYPIQIGTQPGHGISGEQEFWILPSITADIPTDKISSWSI